jgi:hypothetical protein
MPNNNNFILLGSRTSGLPPSSTTASPPLPSTPVSSLSTYQPTFISDAYPDMQAGPRPPSARASTSGWPSTRRRCPTSPRRPLPTTSSRSPRRSPSRTPAPSGTSMAPTSPGKRVAGVFVELDIGYRVIEMYDITVFCDRTIAIYMLRPTCEL